MRKIVSWSSQTTSLASPLLSLSFDIVCDFCLPLSSSCSHISSFPYSTHIDDKNCLLSFFFHRVFSSHNRLFLCSLPSKTCLEKRHENQDTFISHWMNARTTKSSHTANDYDFEKKNRIIMQYLSNLAIQYRHDSCYSYLWVQLKRLRWSNTRWTCIEGWIQYCNEGRSRIRESIRIAGFFPCSKPLLLLLRLATKDSLVSRILDADVNMMYTPMNRWHDIHKRMEWRTWKTHLILKGLKNGRETRGWIRSQMREREVWPTLLQRSLWF